MSKSPNVYCAYCHRSFDARRPLSAAQRVRDAHERIHEQQIAAQTAIVALAQKLEGEPN